MQNSAAEQDRPASKYVAEIVANAPPLSPTQADALAAVLAPPTGVRTLGFGLSQ